MRRTVVVAQVVGRALAREAPEDPRR